MDTNTFTLWFLAFLAVVTLCLVGFISGFGAALALVVGTVLLCRLYWRYVPRQALAYDYQFLYRNGAL